GDAVAAVHTGHAPVADPVHHDRDHPARDRRVPNLRAGAGALGTGRAGPRHVHRGPVPAADEQPPHVLGGVDRAVRDHHGLHRPVPGAGRAAGPGAGMSASQVIRRRDRLAPLVKIAFPVWVVLAVLIVLFPLYLIFMVSFAPGDALFGERPPLVITHFTLRWWQRVIEGGELVSPLIKSLTVATITTV